MSRFSLNCSDFSSCPNPGHRPLTIYFNRLLRLMKRAPKAIETKFCIRRIEDWVHPDCKLVLVGESGHPQIVGTIISISTSSLSNVCYSRHQLIPALFPSKMLQSSAHFSLDSAHVIRYRHSFMLTRSFDLSAAGTYNNLRARIATLSCYLMVRCKRSATGQCARLLN